MKIGESRIIMNTSMMQRMTIHETMMRLYNIGIIIRQYLAMESLWARQWTSVTTRLVVVSFDN
jgi:hypothetical protein